VYKLFLKPFFFLLSPESAHRFALALLEFALKLPGMEWLLRNMFAANHPSLEKEVAGIHFQNPVGLAAGFDKDARHLHALSILGFGFIEVGTVTPMPQPGNPRPRSFRLPKDEALINRMGFNNLGVDVAAARIMNYRNSTKHPVIIGGNIGKNKITPNEKAADDYVTCFQKLFDVVDYFVVNVSSPNTPGLRELQEKGPLKDLLMRLQSLNHSHENPKPIFLKIAPDLANEQLNDIVEIVLESKIAGVIATNTTVSRGGLKTASSQVEKIGTGGLSGKPLAKRSNEIIRYLKAKSQNRFAIMGVGGIHSAADAKEKLSAGADLVQIYTGMIYEGPGLIRKILRSLSK
jgi:dihydroorotate dehydrogenase